LIIFDWAFTCCSVVIDVVVRLEHAVSMTVSFVVPLARLVRILRRKALRTHASVLECVRQFLRILLWVHVHVVHHLIGNKWLLRLFIKVFTWSAPLVVG